MHTWWSPGGSALLKTLLFLLGLHCPYRREISLAPSEKSHTEHGQFNFQKNQSSFYLNSAFCSPTFPFHGKIEAAPRTRLSLSTLPGFQGDSEISSELRATWYLKGFTFTKKENILWLVLLKSPNRGTNESQDLDYHSSVTEWCEPKAEFQHKQNTFDYLIIGPCLHGKHVVPGIAQCE